VRDGCVGFNRFGRGVFGISGRGAGTVAPFEGGLAAAFEAGTACGCLGTDLLGCSYVMPDRPWTGRDGVERRGVLVTLPPGAAGHSLMTGLMDTRQLETLSRHWNNAPEAMHQLEMLAGEVVLHTFLPFAPGMWSVMHTLDSFARMQQSGRWNVSALLEYYDNATGERDPTRDEVVLINILRPPVINANRLEPRNQEVHDMCCNSYMLLRRMPSGSCILVTMTAPLTRPQRSGGNLSGLS
jgi:hypothetical protein